MPRDAQGWRGRNDCTVSIRNARASDASREARSIASLFASLTSGTPSTWEPGNCDALSPRWRALLQPHLLPLHLLRLTSAAFFIAFAARRTSLNARTAPDAGCAAAIGSCVATCDSQVVQCLFRARFGWKVLDEKIEHAISRFPVASRASSRQGEHCSGSVWASERAIRGSRVRYFSQTRLRSLGGGEKRHRDRVGPSVAQVETIRLFPAKRISSRECFVSAASSTR